MEGKSEDGVVESLNAEMARKQMDETSGKQEDVRTDGQDEDQIRKMIGETSDIRAEKTAGEQNGTERETGVETFEGLFEEVHGKRNEDPHGEVPGETNGKPYDGAYDMDPAEPEEPGRRRILPWILFAILILGIAVAYAYISYVYQLDKAERQARSDAIEKEANPYRVELARLKTELEAKKKDLTWTSEQAMIMIGFALTGEDDADYICELAETYGFSPVAVIDCALAVPEDTDDTEDADISGLTGLIDLSAGLGWEIMLTATDFAEDTNTVICAVLSYMEEKEIEESGIFLLRDDFATDENIARLLADGFVGYTLFHSDTPESGQNEDGSIYFEYYYAEQTSDAITNKLSSLHQSDAAMIFCIDMEKVNSGVIRENFIKSFITRARAYVDQYDDCTWATVAEVVEELSAITETEAEALAEYEEYLAETEARIAELEEIIAEIYAIYGE